MIFLEGLATFPFPMQLALGLTAAALLAWIVSVLYFGVRFLRLALQRRPTIVPPRRAATLLLTYAVACLALGYFTPIKNDLVETSVGLLVVGLVIGLFLWPILKSRTIILMFSFVIAFSLLGLLAVLMLRSALPPSQAIRTWAPLIMLGVQIVYAVVFVVLMSFAVSDAFGRRRTGIYWAAFIGGFVPKSYLSTAILISSITIDGPNPEMLVLTLADLQSYSIYFFVSLPLLLCLISQRSNNDETAKGGSP